MFVNPTAINTTQKKLISLILVTAILLVYGSAGLTDYARSGTSALTTDHSKDTLFTPDSAFALLKTGSVLRPIQPIKQHQHLFALDLSKNVSAKNKARILESVLPILPILLSKICIRGMLPDILAPPSV